jgi:hypothetical protein
MVRRGLTRARTDRSSHLGVLPADAHRVQSRGRRSHQEGHGRGEVVNQLLGHQGQVDVVPPGSRRSGQPNRAHGVTSPAQRASLRAVRRVAGCKKGKR